MNGQIKLLFDKVNEILNKYEEISKISGENFNVFKIIDLTTDEVRMHSKFLSELLNPEGSHGQGDVFLKLFTEDFEIKDFETETAKIYIEKSIGVKTDTEGGRIDILLKNDDNKTIIIENKIYAGDQYNQLVRYHNYSKDNVFYLTLFGDEPTKESSGDLEINKDFKLLSYKYDITNWLDKCKKEAVNLPLLREGITHYINLIRFLTGKSTNEIMEKQIRDFIALTPENIKSAITVANSLEQAKIKLQYLFWKSLKEEFETNEIRINGENESEAITWRTITNYYQKSRNNKYYRLWYKIFQNESITVHYGIEIDHNIYYGFTIERNGKGEISNNEEFEEIRQFINKMDENYQNNQWWLGWKYTEPLLNFREFNSEVVFNLANRDYLKSVVSNIAENSIKDIKLLQQYLEKTGMFLKQKNE